MRGLCWEHRPSEHTLSNLTPPADAVERAVAALPEGCVVLTAGIPLAQRDPLRLVCNNSALCGMGVVPIPYWFEDQSAPCRLPAAATSLRFKGR